MIVSTPKQQVPPSSSQAVISVDEEDRLNDATFVAVNEVPDIQSSLFRAVEEAQNDNPPIIKDFGCNLEEVDSVQPGERFKLTARINELLLKQPTDDIAGLKNLLVAFCKECSQEWQYSNFVNSFSERGIHPRNRSLTAAESEEEESDFGAINYLCSEEEYTNHHELESNDHDEDVMMDRSYSFICPTCKSRGIPDVRCALLPSFVFRLHATGNDSKCLHILASGLHAEYFLGTKADHVLRSAEIWKRAERRIAKLVGSKQPLVLALRRSEANPGEIHLENTKMFYSITNSSTEETGTRQRKTVGDVEIKRDSIKRFCNILKLKCNS